jgi:hypothetical protein
MESSIGDIAQTMRENDISEDIIEVNVNVNPRKL